MASKRPLARFGSSGPGLALHDFLPRLEEYLEESFGPLVYSFRTGKDSAPQLPSRAAVRAILVGDGLTGAALEKAEQVAMLENRKIHAKLTLDHATAIGKAFAAVLNCLTTRGREAVRGHKDFSSARDSEDLVKLRDILIETHGSTYGMSKAETATQLRREYFALRQKPDQSLFSFRSELDQLRSSLRIVGGSRPTEEEAARDFLEWLDSTRFGGLQAELATRRTLSASASAVSVFPSTVQAAFGIAYNWEREHYKSAPEGRGAGRAARTGAVLAAVGPTRTTEEASKATPETPASRPFRPRRAACTVPCSAFFSFATTDPSLRTNDEYDGSKSSRCFAMSLSILTKTSLSMSASRYAASTSIPAT
jgi:hypothetical protein